MVTIKSYTDIEQSKKLAEILPLESADMHYNNASIKGINYVDEYRAELMDYNTAQKVLSKYLVNPMFGIIPCWSLAALLNVLPNSIYDNTNEFSQLEFTKKSVAYIHGTTGDIKIGTLKDNLIDACYELILKLHELKML